MPGTGREAGRPWLPPLSILTVAGMISKDHNVTIHVESTQGRLTPRRLPKADLYGISGYSTSRLGAYKLATTIRADGGQVIAGGMEVTGRLTEGYGDELLAQHGAIVDGRLTPAVMARIVSDAGSKQLKGIYRVEDGELWAWGPPRHDQVRRKHARLRAVVQSSAGCPYTRFCPFCTVHLISESKIHEKPLDILAAELKTLPRHMILVDAADTFGCGHRNHTDEVLKLYKRTHQRWVTETTLEKLVGYNGQPALLGPMKDSGCVGAYIGIEDIEGAIGKKGMPRDQVEEAIREIHNAGLMILGSFVLDGKGNETRESIKETVAWIIDNRLDLVQLSLIAALPGSVTQREEKIISCYPGHLDGAWPTIERPLSPKDRIESLAGAYEEIHSKENIKRRISHLHGWQHTLAWWANWQIHKTAKRWRAKNTYDYWCKTRELPPHTNSDPE